LVRRTARTVLAVVLAAATLAGQPRRIVSTAPSITELLFALGLGDRVVGVTRFSQKKTIIGDYINPNIEAIASLQPDLVIVQQNPVRLTERLNALHLHTLEIDQQNAPLADSIYKSIRIVGEATGTRQRAAQLADSIRAGLESVRARSAPLKRTRDVRGGARAGAAGWTYRRW
jgi:iron complex transport system substrate-binding protein